MASIRNLWGFRSLDSLLKFSSASYPREEVIESVGKRRVMVFAPHSDDEVFGCGGTIARCIQKGSRVRVVYMTDGRNGNPSFSPEEMAIERKKEAIEGLDVLGCKDHIFLDYKDSGLRMSRESVMKTASVIQEFKPDTIFVPFPRDPHPDHIATSQIIGRALRHHPGDVDCFCYEVWNALPPNVFVDISRQIEMKKEAIGKHRTQIEVIDYLEKIVGLNAFRSITCGGNARYCEAFLKLSRKDYVELSQSLAGR